MGGYHMKKRKYTQMKAIEQEIERMHTEGATSREIGEQFGLEKEQIHNWISRYNRKQRQLMAGKELRPKTVTASRRNNRAKTVANGKPTVAGFSAFHRKGVGPRLKYHIIYSHRRDYPVSVMCSFFGVSRSGYYYENLLDRNFHADKPNAKWVTDFRISITSEGILYLSMIRDLYDNSIAAYKMAAQQTVSLVLDTIRLAKRKEKVAAGRLQLHSDQGSQYTSQAYFDLTKEYGITPSMSRRGNCYDNAMAENSFSILKTECIYRQKTKSFQQARELIDEFIHFYNYERIQLKTGETPLARCLSA